MVRGAMNWGGRNKLMSLSRDINSSIYLNVSMTHLILIKDSQNLVLHVNALEANWIPNLLERERCSEYHPNCLGKREPNELAIDPILRYITAL